MIVENTKKRTGFKTWLLIWGLGLAGQLCWNIENQWFNTFVYAKIQPKPWIVSWMVAVSAVMTTVATFIFGTMSDRMGKRRFFVAFGYIAWGISTIAFGLTEFISKEQWMVAAVLVVIADAVMSFFGSMGNDSGFNAWTNDTMRPHNRGQIGAALATQPVIGTIVGTLVGGMLIGSNPDPSKRNYMLLFLVMGGFVILVGIISLFTMKEDVSLKPYKEGKFWQQFAKVFNFKEFFARKELVLVNVIVTVFFIGFNVYFAQLGNYMIWYLGFTEGDMGLIEGLALIGAMALAIPATILINKKKTPNIIYIAVALSIIGCLTAVLFVTPESVDPTAPFSGANLILMLFVFLIGAGYIIILQATTVWAKELYPKESKGAFEGVRILFFVLFPMVIGSTIATAVIEGSGMPYTDPVYPGISGFIPTESIFLVGACISIFAIIPLIFAHKHYKARIAAEK
jgi:MFS family permease